MRGTAALAVWLMTSITWAQLDTLDTYERFDALRDSLVAWVVSPPLDTVKVTEPVRLEDYFISAQVEIDSSHIFILTFPLYMERSWGRMLGRKTDTGIAWRNLDSVKSTLSEQRLAWLRTLPLPPQLRAPCTDLPDSLAWVLHGRDIYRVTMPAGHVQSVLAWFARNRLILAGEIEDSVKPGSFELFALIKAPESELVHALRWRETRSPENEHGTDALNHEVEIHLYPFIPAGNVSRLFADDDTARSGWLPIPVGPGTNNENDR